MKYFDAIVIGTGQAGPSLAARFAAAGKTVAIIERHKFGGTCVNTGCIPTKTPVASAYAIHVARRGAEYGFTTGDVRVDIKQVKARKDAASARSNKGVEEWLRGTKNCTVIQGQARFQSSNTVMVNDEVLQADKIYINVGGRARIADMPGVHDVQFLTNSSIMDIDFLPEHFIVVGGSYVGLEFAQIYRRLGSEVTVVEMGPRLIGREDEDVSQAVREILEAEGIRVRLNAKCISLAKRDGGVVVGMECSDDPKEVAGKPLVLAVGRVPNTNHPGLERARGLYVDPPLGRCGMTDAEVRKSGRRAFAAKYPMSQVSRAYEKGETQGFIKICIDAETKQILGAAILGVGGDEVIHVLLDVMYAKAPYTVIQRAMHIHPTVAEYLPIILAKLEPFA